jgi:pimeloyl-[acyl-carrier protein] methyl ester esterase
MEGIRYPSSLAPAGLEPETHMTSSRITLLHGWGFDASLWRDVLPRLRGLDVEVCDLGYFGRPALPQPCDAPRVAVGHSLGALWWLALTDLPWRRLVVINGFPRFTAAADFPHGVAPRVLKRMRKRFGEAPGAVLDDFRAACGAPPDVGPALPVDTAPLAAGLAQLADGDGRETFARRQADIWAFASRDDAIVPPALSESAFGALGNRLRWCKGGVHLLPLARPEACADLIREAASA